MSLKQAQIEIEDEDIVYRRVRKDQIDENGNPMVKAFALRILNNVPESYLSVNLSEHITPELAIGDKEVFELFKFEVSVPRRIKLGVAHSPTQKDYSHSAVCGFFNEDKSETLAESSEKIVLT